MRLLLGRIGAATIGSGQRLGLDGTGTAIASAHFANRYRDRIDESLFLPRVNWREPLNRRQPQEDLVLAAGVREP